MATRLSWHAGRLKKLEELTEHYTFKEIAEMWGTNTSTVQMAAKRHGIKGKQRNKNFRGVAIIDYKAREEDNAQPDPFGPPRQTGP